MARLTGTGQEMRYEQRMRGGVLIATLILLGSSGAAHAQRFGKWEFGATLSYEARVVHADATDPAIDVTQVATAGVSSRAFAGKRDRLAAFAAGFDFQFGGGASGGFAYEFDFYPVGIAMRMGDRAHVGVVAGVGLSGLTDRVDFAMQFPVEGFVEFALGRRLRVMTWGSSRWVASSEARTSGVVDMPFGDEFAAGAGVRWGKRRDQHRAAMGNGYFIGALYQERLGVKFYGATLGYNLNFASKTPKPRRPYMPTVQPHDR